MNPIFAAALEVQAFCRERSWRFCFIGGLTVQRWGEPRLTQDVDITLLTGFGTEAPYVDALLAGFAGRRPDAREFALRHRVVLVRSRAGIPVDVALGAMPFEERAVARASEFVIQPGVALVTCSAEDRAEPRAGQHAEGHGTEDDPRGVEPAGRGHALMMVAPRGVDSGAETSVTAARGRARPGVA